jgi:hypothetical protein
MEENYQNLSFFHSATVLMIILGVLLVLSIIFLSLPMKHQVQVAQAFQILDIHKEWGDQIKIVKLVYQIQERFYDEFYFAFIDVVALPDQIEFIEKHAQLAYQNLGTFSDGIISDQIRNNGTVLGSFIESR